MGADPNAARFSGFAGLYDAVRPAPPGELGEALAAYSGGAGAVVDLGAGTGLSTRWAASWAMRVIGVEPNPEMRAIARERSPELEIVAGTGQATGLDADSADVVIAVQAFHWMDPEATLSEVARVLRPGGVFAAIDCDWPPAIGHGAVEAAWGACRADLRVLERRVALGETDQQLRRPIDRDGEWDSYDGVDPHRNRTLADGVRSWPKTGHLAQIAASGFFEWSREVAVHAREHGDADRFVGLLRSQGDYQALRRHGLSDAELGVDSFEAMVHDVVGADPRPWLITFRARIGGLAH